MINTFLPAEKQRILDSFFSIVNDQPVAVAVSCLEATHWRIEDALEFFYSGRYSSSVIDCPASSTYATDISFPPADVEPCTVSTTTAAAEAFTWHRKRRTRSEMKAAENTPSNCVVRPLVASRHRRTRSELPSSKLGLPSTSPMPDAQSLTSAVQLRSTNTPCSHPGIPSSSTARPMVRPTPCASKKRAYHKRSRLQIEAENATWQQQSKVIIPKAIGTAHVPSECIPLPDATVCLLCGATKFAFESPSLCCGNGTVRLSEIECPDRLRTLLSSDDTLGDHFRQYCRAYNNYFAFTCLGGNIDASNGSGFFTFILHGQIYHYLPNLIADNQSPKFMQMYFYEGAPEFDVRCNSFQKLLPELIADFIALTSHNPYARFFRSLRSFPIQDTTQLRIFTNPCLNQRVYNAPTSDEVAAIIVESSSSDRVNSPHVTVYGKADHEHHIRHYFGCYDPLQYPLLFTRGETGWHQGLRRVKPIDATRCDAAPFPIVPGVVHNATDILAQELGASSQDASKSGRSLSCRDYYAYRFQMRPNNFLIHMGRIFVQYIVDMYVKIENTRLDYLKHHQTTLRSDLYQGVMDSVNAGNESAAQIGRRVVLPSSFIGGPRDMRCRFLNAMSLVQHFGKPDIFLTMTCNPNWPEIKDRLRPGEKTDHRPDLVARVFNAKARLLRKLIVEEQIFGPVAARVDVVEFQKRGLPHLHMLIILERGSKITDPDSFDQYVCAELPPPEKGRLRSLVERNMMHGPCGDLGPNCSCMQPVDKEVRCKAHYPKDFAEFTTSSDESYPIYRRRDNQDFVTVRGADLDNRWVVPYNPYLLSTFDCHLNVEICSTVQAVKYLYKYVYKGHDKVCFDIARTGELTADEISAFQSGRWISGPEAAWRIFEFDLYSMRPAVIPLQVHLPHMHVIRFAETANLMDIINNENRSATMLTEYFTANRLLPDAARFLYTEFPLYFTWCNTKKKWHERVGAEAIGRLTFVNPQEGERYYLRLLLIHVRGATSFDDLLSFEGVRYTTFRQAAEKHGLLERDDHAETCLHDAVAVQMPGALRRLFATLLVFCDQIDPPALWEQFYPSLSEDYAHRFKGQHTKILNLTYADVASYLEGMGRTMREFHLHSYSAFGEDGFRLTRDITDALDAPVPVEYIDAHAKLNVEQRSAYDCIMTHVEKKLPGAFFIDGPGGTGKTFLYCALYGAVRALGKIVLPTATSGIAASNMPTGRTAHFRFKIPIAHHGLKMCNISKQSSSASLLREAALIIWDEASMANKEDIEAVDRLLQDICNSKQIFGGKLIVFGGDFRQVMLVLPHKSQVEVVNASLVSSYLWPSLKKFRLQTNIRASADPEFANFLLRLGNGELQSASDAEVSLPSSIKCHPIQHNSFSSLKETMFPEMKDNSFDSSIFGNRAILTPTNEGVDAINATLINGFPGLPHTYNSFDAIIDDNRTLFPTEYLNSLHPTGMSPHELILKEGCPVILLRNRDPSNGLCNGTRLICRVFRKDVIVCEIAVGYYKGTRVFIPRINLRPPENVYPFQFERKQFPIKLCFAMTINKSQGQTLDFVCVYLTQPCFSHGQIYVAFSRTKKSSCLTVFLPENHYNELSENRVVNVVSLDVLCRAGILIPTSS